jgi:hypothetical protein
MSAPFPVCSRAIAQPNHDSFGLNLRLRSPEVEVEFSAATGRLRVTDIAAEPQHDLLDNTQTEAGAAFLARIRGIRLRELLKEPRPEGGGDARATIPDGGAEVFPAVFYRDSHFSLLRRKFDRVGQQIGDDLGQAVGIGLNLEVGGVLQSQRYAVRVS